MSLGQNLRYIRKQKKLSQIELAKLAGITERSIYNYETEKQYPKPRVIMLLSNALSISPNALTTNSIDDLKDLKKFTCKEKTYLEVVELLEKTAALFAGGTLSEKAKDEFFESIVQAYFVAKRKTEEKNQKKDVKE